MAGVSQDFTDMTAIPTQVQIPAVQMPFQANPALGSTPERYYEIDPAMSYESSAPARKLTTSDFIDKIPTPVRGQTPSPASRLIQPWPLWRISGMSLVGGLFLAAIVFFNADWATGAALAGAIALTTALLVLIYTGVRVALGMLQATNPHRRRQLLATGLALVMLFTFAAYGMGQQSAIHAMQARYSENQQNYSLAYSEFQAAGEKAPTSVDLARVTTEWGEAFANQQQYALAVTKLTGVLQNFSRVPVQVQRAQNDLIATYISWSATQAHLSDYVGAAYYLDTLLAQSYCTVACQSLATPKAAVAYYQLAEQSLSGQQYTQAVQAFATLATRFASATDATETRKIHADYASALWGLGQQQVKSTCANAVSTYQQLASSFNDTTQGKQATSALQQPVNVTGRFTGKISGSGPTVYLVQGLTVGYPSDQVSTLVTNAPKTSVQSNGSYTFANVAQGKYALVWTTNPDSLKFFYGVLNNNQVVYTANVGPLCVVAMGNIAQDIV
jgi:hypothetical protein